MGLDENGKCQQESSITEIKTTLVFFKEAESRRELREERMLRAMEDISAHGATITNLTQRTGKLEKDVTEAFGIMRMISDTSAKTSAVKTVEMEVKNLDGRVKKIELYHAEEKGEIKITEKNDRFWDDIKKQSTPYAFTLIFFMLWLMDKLNIFTNIAKLWKEYKG